MSIIPGFKNFKEYIKETDGYRLISRWTSSHTVVMDNGNTLEEEIKNIENEKVEEVVNAQNIPYNNTDSKLQSENVQDAIDEIFDKIYPIGSIYMSVSSTNPTELFGGTWVAWGAGRVPIGVNASDNDFNSAEKTGGSKTQALFAAIGATNNDSSTIGYAVGNPISNKSYLYSVKGTSTTQNIPASQVNYSTAVYQSNGNNPSTIQPYITCYMWKRTA